MFVLGSFIFLPSLKHCYFLLGPLDGRRQYFLNGFRRIIATILLGIRVFVRWGWVAAGVAGQTEGGLVVDALVLGEGRLVHF